MEDLSLMAKRLEEVDAHDGLFLLSHCLAIPRMTYILRSAPCFRKLDILAQYNDIIRSSLESILNAPLDDEAWSQGSLPVSWSGVGIRKATEVSVPAFLASAFGAEAGMKNLLPSAIFEQIYEEATEAELSWRTELNNNDLQPQNKTVQACWDAPLIESRFKTLLINKDTPVEKARLLALASHQASTWLTAIPISSLGLKLDNNTLRVAICLRLGTKICEPHTCICGQLVDPLGRHGLSCRLACGTHSRHKRVNDILRRSIASSGTPAMVEPRGLMDDDKRPDGLTLYPWSGGKSVCWDFTCRDSLCQSHVSGTSKEAGNAAKQAESLKLRHYEELTQNFTVIPVATETMVS